MKVSNALNTKLYGLWGNSVKKELDAFCSFSACAGIRNNVSAANKARGNHYGEFYIDEYGNEHVNIPVRRFVQAAVNESNDVRYDLALKQAIEGLFKNKGSYNNPSGFSTREIEKVKEKDPVTGGFRFTSRQVGTEKTIFPKEAADKEMKGYGAYKVREDFTDAFQKIANQMADNMVHAIDEVNIEGLRRNANMTIRLKGFDHPLVETGEMRDAIEGWVE